MSKNTKKNTVLDNEASRQLSEMIKREHLFTIEQAGSILGLGDSAIRMQIKKGVFAHGAVKVGGVWIIKIYL